MGVDEEIVQVELLLAKAEGLLEKQFSDLSDIRLAIYEGQLELVYYELGGVESLKRSRDRVHDRLQLVRDQLRGREIQVSQLLQQMTRS